MAAPILPIIGGIAKTVAGLIVQEWQAEVREAGGLFAYIRAKQKEAEELRKKLDEGGEGAKRKWRLRLISRIHPSR